MGCWNKTCGLTNLPIFAGDPVYTIILERNNLPDNHCYSSHLYRPLPLPFECEYDDYGCGENTQGIVFPMILAAIQANLVEMPEGENPYHDIAVSRDAWNEKLFWESLRESRLRVNYSYRQELELDFVMFRKDAVDHLMATHNFEQYVGQGNGNSGYENSYINYTFADLMQSADEVFGYFREYVQQRKWPEMDTAVMLYLQNNLNNQAALWLRGDSLTRSCNLIYVRDKIMELLKSGDTDLAHHLFSEHLKFLFLHIFMDITRKSWIPGGHEGSQQSDFAPYRSLINVMSKIMADIDADFEEENE